MRRMSTLSLGLAVLALWAGIGCESTQMRQQPAVKWQSAPAPARDAWNVPFGGKEPSYRRVKGAELSNPLPADAAIVKLGQRLFQRNCDFCHGSNGKGDGPVAEKLFPVPKDLTSERVQRLNDGDIFLAITRGEGTMPSFRTDLTPRERWTLVRYIRAAFGGKKPVPGADD